MYFQYNFIFQIIAVAFKVWQKYFRLNIPHQKLLFSDIKSETRNTNENDI